MGANAKKGSMVVAGKIGAVMAASLLACSTACMPAAHAVEGQTGSGETSLVVKLADAAEHGGTAAVGELANPDVDGDGIGDNLAFTVPIRLDYAAKASGELVGPSGNAAYIKNESRYDVRVSSLDVDEKNGWKIVSDADSSSLANSIELHIGPKSDLLEAAAYLDKADVNAPSEWNMAAKCDDGSSDRVVLSSRGSVNNVSAPIGEDVTFGQVNWYVRPGRA